MTVDDLCATFLRSGGIALSERQAYRWVAGRVKTLPYPRAQAILRTIFNEPAAALLGPPQPPPGAPVAALAVSFPAVDPQVEVGTVDRRGFLSVAAAALTVGMESSRHVDPQLVDYFTTQLEGHYRADMMLGPRELVETTSAQFRLIDRLTRGSTGSTRTSLLKIGTAYAAFIGWLFQDAGDLVAALFWRGVTQEMAHRSGDADLVGYALVNSASIRTDLADGRGVTDLCELVLNGPSRARSPKVRVMALQQMAHGASLFGDRALVDRLLDEAAPLVSLVDDLQPWGNACRRTPNYVEIQRATCYGRLGLNKESISTWSQVLHGFPSSARRDMGVYLARQAVACANNSDPGQAVHLARDAAHIAVETGSARTRNELRVLSGRMARWKGASVGREFEDVLAMTMRDSDGNS